MMKWCTVHDKAHPATWALWRRGPKWMGFEYVCDEAVLEGLRSVVKENETMQVAMYVSQIVPGAATLPLPPPEELKC